MVPALCLGQEKNVSSRRRVDDVRALFADYFLLLRERRGHTYDVCGDGGGMNARDVL